MYEIVRQLCSPEALFVLLAVALFTNSVKAVDGAAQRASKFSGSLAVIVFFAALVAIFLESGKGQVVVIAKGVARWF